MVYLQNIAKAPQHVMFSLQIPNEAISTSLFQIIRIQCTVKIQNFLSLSNSDFLHMLIILIIFSVRWIELEYSALLQSPIICLSYHLIFSMKYILIFLLTLTSLTQCTLTMIVCVMMALTLASTIHFFVLKQFKARFYSNFQ